MRVEVLQARAPVGHKRVGDIIPDMPEGVANGLIARGIVRAALASPVDRMVTMSRRGVPAVRKGVES